MRMMNFGKLKRYFIFLLVTCLTMPVMAEEHTLESFWKQQHLTGDWGGLRSQLEEDGISLGGSYEVGFSKNTRGGISSSGSSNKQRFTLNATFDFDKLFGLEGGKFFVQYQNHQGAMGTDETGDIQQYDGLDDPEYDRIHMFWYEQWLLDKKIRLKIGKVEPKSEFFAPLNGKHHLGVSTERSPSIGHGPPADSVNLFYILQKTYSSPLELTMARLMKEEMRTIIHFIVFSILHQTRFI